MAPVSVSLSRLMASSPTRHHQWQVSSLMASVAVTLSTRARGKSSRTDVNVTCLLLFYETLVSKCPFDGRVSLC